jgi:outer membrane receptor for ferrienterochelin and colicins
MKKTRNIVSLTTVLVALVTPHAHAQSIDYGSLETLFGEPVTTSATGKPQRASEAPVAMEILTAEQIRRTGAHNIAEIMRTVSGMSFNQWSRESYDMNIRGNNQQFASRLLVLVNGRQVYLDHYGYTDWTSIPVQIAEIQQIEIVKGPNTALFGFNAVDGVVNIITYNPLHDHVSNATVSVGTRNHKQADVTTTLPFSERASVRLSASKMLEHEFKGNSNGAETPSIYTDPARQSFNVDGAFKITDDSVLRIEGSNNDAHHNTMIPLFFLIPEQYKTSGMKASYEMDTAAGLITTSLYQNTMNMHTLDGINVGMKNRITVAKVEDLIQAGHNNTFRIMSEYRDNGLRGMVIGDGAEISYKNYAVSGMWNWMINDNFDLTNAVRADYLMLNRSGGGLLASNPYADKDYDQQTLMPSYNSSLVWKATDSDKFRISAGRGIESPSLYELGSNFVVLGPAIIGDPRQKPALVDNYELGWDKKIASANLNLKSSVFYKTMRDIKAPPLTAASSNIGSSDSIGAELGLHGVVSQFYTWDMGYIIENTNVNLATNQAPRRFDVLTPTHMVNAHLGYKKDSWELDGYANYVSDTQNYEPNDGLTNVGSYITVSARAAYYLNEQTSIALSGQNLQSQDTQQTSGPDVERTVYLTLSRDF